MNVEKAIRTAVNTGKVVLGERETIKAARNKGLKLVIVAENCPMGLKEEIRRYAGLSKTRVYEFKESSVALGSVCGKPFIVSMLGVFDAGDSDVLEIGKRA